MSKIRETVERMSSQKKKEKRYSGLDIKVRIISIVNKAKHAIIAPEKKSSADFGVTAKRKSSPNSAKTVTNKNNIPHSQLSNTLFINAYVFFTARPFVGPV